MSQFATPRVRPAGVFDDLRKKVYDHRYRITLHMNNIVGGTPAHPKTAEAWIRSKVEDSEETIQRMVAQAMLDTAEAGGEASIEQAAGEVSLAKNLKVFKRTSEGELAIEGRQVKSMIAEAANIVWTNRGQGGPKWGVSQKSTLAFLKEHVFIAPEFDAIGLGVKEPDYIQTRFVHTFNGNGISLEEVVEDCDLTFEYYCDFDISKQTAGTGPYATGRDWGQLWVTAEDNGLGALRSQGYGRFTVTEFERL